MKICARCKEEKDRLQFYKESRKKDGLCSICIECEKKRCADRKNKDVEHYRKLKRENARKHSEKRKEKWKEKYPKIKEEYLARSRKRYHENRERIIARRKEIGKSEESKKKDADRQRKWQNEHRENVRKAALKYCKTHREKVLKWHKEWKDKNKIQSRANRMVIDHVRRGKLIRPTKCEKCMKECKPDGHHRDYNKPLEVIWLCKICHNHEHGKLMDVKP